MIKLNTLAFTHTQMMILADMSEFKGGWPLLSNLPDVLLKAQLSHGRNTDKIVALPQYGALLEEIDLNATHVPFCESLILKYAQILNNHRGYKQKENSIPLTLITQEHPSSIVRLKTTTCLDTPSKIKELCHWVNNSLEQNATHPLIAIAIFKFVFIAISPFEHNNDNLSDALCRFLFFKTGYAYLAYASLDRQLSLRKDEQAHTFYQTYLTLTQSAPDLSLWIDFMLSTFHRQKREVEHWILSQSKAEDTLSQIHPLRAQILTYLKNFGKTSISQLENLTGANRNTLKKHLAQLVHGLFIKQHGKGPATWYTLN